MRTIVLAIAVLVLVPATLFAVPAAPAKMQEGQWEVTVKVEMEGVPFPMPPMTHTQCITKADQKDVKKTIPSTTTKENECAVKDHKVLGNKISWHVQCKDGSSGAGEMVAKSTSYTGTMTMETKNKEQGATKIVQHITGKRVGDCK
jgi:hypothetical protein